MQLRYYSFLFTVLSLISAASIASAGPPSIQKVEPPNWWSGMALQEVQLMVYGEGLDQITAHFDDERIQVKAVHTLPNPTYAFIDILIPDDLPAGTYTLHISSAEGSTSIDYPILERESRTNRHRGFSPEDVIYLITPDRFANGNSDNDRIDGLLDEYNPSEAGMRHGGDLEGIINQLDYLADLGVTALWLNPVLENRGRNSYHGYAATDLYRVDARFGSNADYKRLVDEAHRRGLKIIFDHVNNHIGIQHPWIDNLPMPDWLNGSVADHASHKHYKLAPTDPHADPYSDSLLRTFWFVDAMPDLNLTNPYLATYRIQNTLWWIEYSGIDGIREDTYPYSDQAFLARWAKSIRDAYPDFNIVGEIWELEPAYLSIFQKETRLPRDFETHLPAIMDFPLSDAFRQYLMGSGKLADIYKVISQDFVYTDTQNLMTLFDNHDMARGIFIADGDEQKLRQVLAMLLTIRGIPQLLYGTEIGMVGGERHIELRADFPGGFPGHTRSAFTKEGRTKAEEAIHSYVRKLLHLRKSSNALTQGKMIHYPPPRYNVDVYKYLRIYEDEKVLVLVNGEDERREIDLSEVTHWFGENRDFVDVLEGSTLTISAQLTIPVEARGIKILMLQQ